MANRYWRGGTGTWDTTTTTNWSTSSGGAGGASVPTASDSVFFDQAGTYTVTMTGALTCLDITVSAGTVTFATGTAPTLAISGSMSVIAGTVWSSTGAITFNATTTGKTITTNNISITAPIVLSGVGGGWTLGSSFTQTDQNGFTVTNGSFSTSASNYAMTIYGLYSTNSNTRSISLNGSTITLTANLAAAIDFTTSTNLTFSAGTSTLSIASPTFNFYGGGQTFYNLNLTNTTGNAFTSQTNMTGANTFTNITKSTATAVGNIVITLANSITITGTLTCPGGTTAAISRVTFASNPRGTPVTITAAAVSLVDVDFNGITAAGAAAPFTGTRLGNCGGNSNITFPAAKTVYFVGTTAANWGSSQWATSSGGSTSINNFPLAQDTAVIDNSSLNTSAVLTVNASYNIGNLTFSQTSNVRTNAITFTIGSVLVYFVGTFLTYSSAVTQTNNNAQFYWNNSILTITSNGASTASPFNINGSGTVKLGDNYTSTSTTSGSILSNSTLDLNNNTLTTRTFSAGAVGAVFAISYGTSGQITVVGTGSVISFSSGTFTYTGTSNITINNNTSTATSVSASGQTESNAQNYNIISGSYAFTASTALKNLTFTSGFTGSLANGTRTIYGNLTLVSGMTVTAGTSTTTFSATSGTQQITTAAQTLDFPLTVNGVGGTVQLQDALTMGSSRLFTHTNGTVDLNGKTLTVGSNYTTATGTKNLTFNGGTLVCPATSTTAFNNAAPTNYTTTAGTGGNGTISLTGATAKTFVGGGSTYAATLNQGGAGTLTISGSNTLAGISNSYSATGATTISFTSSTTQTVSSFTATGTVGKVLTLNAVTSGTFASMVLSSGTVSGIDYLSIQDSHVTPATTTWYAGANSTNVSGNTGWIFTAAPAANTGNFFIFLGS
jgi:hypothetical protein